MLPNAEQFNAQTWLNLVCAVHRGHRKRIPRAERQQHSPALRAVGSAAPHWGAQGVGLSSTPASTGQRRCEPQEQGLIAQGALVQHLRAKVQLRRSPGAPPASASCRTHCRPTPGDPQTSEPDPPSPRTKFQVPKAPESALCLDSRAE